MTTVRIGNHRVTDDMILFRYVAHNNDGITIQRFCDTELISVHYDVCASEEGQIPCEHHSCLTPFVLMTIYGCVWAYLTPYMSDRGALVQVGFNLHVWVPVMVKKMDFVSSLPPTGQNFSQNIEYIESAC